MLKDTGLASKVPAHTLSALDRYVNDRIPTGGFLRAVLSNDLKQAFAQADSSNRAALYDIMMYCTWEIPAVCWGSRERYTKWLEGRGEENRND